MKLGVAVELLRAASAGKGLCFLYLYVIFLGLMVFQLASRAHEFQRGKQRSNAEFGVFDTVRRRRLLAVWRRLLAVRYDVRLLTRPMRLLWR